MRWTPGGAAPVALLPGARRRGGSGVVVYEAASIEEARSLAEADPAVKAGRLKIEMHPWMVQKGIIREPGES